MAYQPWMRNGTRSSHNGPPTPLAAPSAWLVASVSQRRATYRRRVAACSCYAAPRKGHSSLPLGAHFVGRCHGHRGLPPGTHPLSPDLASQASDPARSGPLVTAPSLVAGAVGGGWWRGLRWKMDGREASPPPSSPPRSFGPRSARVAAGGGADSSGGRAALGLLRRPCRPPGSDTGESFVIREVHVQVESKNPYMFTGETSICYLGR